MIRIIEHFTKAFVVVITALLCFSCDLGFKKVDGSGNVITQTRSMSGEFTSVEASSGLEVVIMQGDEKSVTVEADDNLQQHIMTEIENGTLMISADVNIRNAASKKVTVKMPVIKGVEASSGSMVRSSDPLKAESLELGSNSGANLDVSVQSKKVKCEASSGSFMKVSGSAEDLKTECSSGSTIDAKGLVAVNVTAEASSGSTISVNPTEELKAEASSGGSIKYTTTPGTLEKNVSSGGSVSQQ